MNNKILDKLNKVINSRVCKITLGTLLIIIFVSILLFLVLNRIIYRLILIHNAEHEARHRSTKIEKEDPFTTSLNEKIIIDHNKRYSSFCKELSHTKENKDRKVLIMFNGLNSDYGYSILGRAKDLFETQEFNFDEILFIKYPKYSFSMEGVFCYNDKEDGCCKESQYRIKRFFNFFIKKIRQILKKCFGYDGAIGHCETTLKKLLIQQDEKGENHGYKAENISFFGHSAGGGISARTIKRFSNNEILKKGEKFASIINYNSFDKNYKTCGSKFDEKDGDDKKTKIRNFFVCKIFKKIILALIWIVSLGYHVDAKDAYLDENLPVQRKDVIYVKGDNIINKDSAMHTALTKENQEYLKKQNIHLHLIEYPKETSSTVDEKSSSECSDSLISHSDKSKAKEDMAKEHSYLNYSLIVESLNGENQGQNFITAG